MRAYVRTSRNTGLGLPWWLALPLGAIYIAGWIVVMTVVVIGMFLIAAGKTGYEWWEQRHRPTV